MRKLFLLSLQAITCVALSGCGDGAASRQAEAARRAAEQRASAAEKARAEDRAAEQKANYDKEAFLTARKAASARTWTAAQQILKRIDLGRIQDSDVVTYVDFAQRCAKLASDLGVDRDADPNSTASVLSGLNVERFVASVIQIATEKGVGQAAQAIADARQIQTEIPVYIELDTKLAIKYGTE